MKQNITMSKEEFVNILRNSMKQQIQTINENTPIEVKIKTKNKTIDFVGIIIEVDLNS